MADKSLKGHPFLHLAGCTIICPLGFFLLMSKFKCNEHYAIDANGWCIYIYIHTYQVKFFGTCSYDVTRTLLIKEFFIKKFYNIRIV